MVVMMSRRAVTLALPWVLASPSAWSIRTTDSWTPDHSDNAMTIIGEEEDFTSVAVAVAVDLICQWTPASFRRAVQITDRFLYRGAEPSAVLDTMKDPPVLFHHPAPDLLLPETYDDPDALAYFTCLEHRLLAAEEPSGIIQARPSTGHVATSNPKEAGRWGHVVSVWPLGTDWSFVWPSDRETLFVESGKRTVGRRNKATQCVTDKQHDSLELDARLMDALTQPREVLFTSWFNEATMSQRRLPEAISSTFQGAFLTIPREQDTLVRRLLRARNFGLS